MAINPPSDIVLDVLNAADPSRAEAVTERLNALGAGKAPAGASEDFAKALAATAPASTSADSAVLALADARGRFLNKDIFHTQKAKQAQVDFEATLLNNFVSEILPKDAPGVFGQGTAGDVWRSMLGDQIARQHAAMRGFERDHFLGHGLGALENRCKGIGNGHQRHDNTPRCRGR